MNILGSKVIGNVRTFQNSIRLYTALNALAALRALPEWNREQAIKAGKLERRIIKLQST